MTFTTNLGNEIPGSPKCRQLETKHPEPQDVHDKCVCGKQKEAIASDWTREQEDASQPTATH